MVHFHHEEPQGVRHSADFSANPIDAGWIEGRQYTKYEPILVMEGKRLPTPGSGREREYVASAAGEKPGGGVQRFKLGLHGAKLSRAGMVGYVQARASRRLVRRSQPLDRRPRLVRRPALVKALTG